MVPTRLSNSHLFEIVTTLLMYTPFLYFNRIKIYTRLITHDTWLVHQLKKKKIFSAVFEKIKKKKRKIFHVNVHFGFSDSNQKLAVLLLAYFELKFRIS